jgi:hypothetical protein|tara:strand:+ start:73 stop:1287 length:1215 start_codon:yes stop_codon:yes gene_type:complete
MGDVADCAAIELDIEGITGVTDANDDFIRSAQKFVVSSIPKNLMLWAMTETVPATHGGNNSNQQITLPVKTDSLLFVRRDQFEASKVDGSMRGFIGNTNSLHKATNTFPKYYIADNNRVIVKPDPDNTYTAHAQYVDYSKINDDSDLRSAVVFHSASSEFSKLAVSKLTDWVDLNVPVSLSSPSFSTPDISSTTVSNIGTPPTYTPPTIPSTAGGSTTTDDLTDMADSDWTELDFDFDDENIDVATWFQALGDMIQNQEDIELANAQMQKISTYVNSYQSAMQNRLNEFNDANAEYQAKLQESIQQAQIDAAEAQQESSLLLQKENQEYASNLQKLSAEVGIYQSEVNEKVQKITSSSANAAFYSAEGKKYYDWAQLEVSSYIKNNSKMISMAMASQSTAQQGR